MAAASDRKGAATHFIPDCSVAVAWCFPDEQTAYPSAVLDSLIEATAVVPALWAYEISNALLSGERRQRATPWDDVLKVARLHRLSAYGAADVELALRRSLPVATIDNRMKTAVKAAGISTYTVDR